MTYLNQGSPLGGGLPFGGLLGSLGGLPIGANSELPFNGMMGTPAMAGAGTNPVPLPRPIQSGTPMMAPMLQQALQAQSQQGQGQQGGGGGSGGGGLPAMGPLATSIMGLLGKAGLGGAQGSPMSPVAPSPPAMPSGIPSPTMATQTPSLLQRIAGGLMAGSPLANGGGFGNAFGGFGGGGFGGY